MLGFGSLFNRDSTVVPGEDDETGNEIGSASNGGYARIESKEEDTQHYNLFASTGEPQSENQISVEKKIAMQEAYLKQCLDAQETLRKELKHLRSDRKTNSHLLETLSETKSDKQPDVAKTKEVMNEDAPDFISSITQYMQSFLITKKPVHVISSVAQEFLVVSNPFDESPPEVKPVLQKKVNPQSILRYYQKVIDISNEIYQIEKRRLELEEEIQLIKSQLQTLKSSKQERDALNDTPWVVSLVRLLG
jgi:hypothetical protein